MANLEQRIHKLEQKAPQESLLSLLTEDELNQRWLELAKSCLANGVPETELASLARSYPASRQFFSNSDLWTNDPMHRMDVFLKFRGVVCRMPEHKRLFDIFGFGWGSDTITPADIDYAMAATEDLDLGPEQPWLREYLQCSGMRP